MNPLKNNRGATLVFIALFLFLLLSFLGLAIDVGWTTYVRNQGQARVDAAALASAARAIPKLPTDPTRGTVAQTSADTFANSNMVVDSSTNPANTVQAMHYEYATHALTATTWTATGATAANAVKVSNAVPTPLFFSGIRNVFGASETGSTTINVDATAYLGCPGTGKPTIPIGFCSSAIGYPNQCNVGNALQVPTPDQTSGFFDPASLGSMNDALCVGLASGTTAMPNIGVGDSVNLQNGQTNCIKAIQTKACTQSTCTCTGNGSNKDCTLTPPWCVLVPVVDVAGCTFNGTKPVAGFAEFCITEVSNLPSNKFVKGSLQCPATYQGGSGGECFGTVATNPILVQ